MTKINTATSVVKRKFCKIDLFEISSIKSLGTTSKSQEKSSEEITETTNILLNTLPSEPLTNANLLESISTEISSVETSPTSFTFTSSSYYLTTTSTMSSSSTLTTATSSTTTTTTSTTTSPKVKN